MYFNLVAKVRTAEITSGDNPYSGEIAIPESILVGDEEYKVTGIGSYAFQQCACLTSVVIPHTVTTIGENAFWGCSGITSVTVPNSVTSIGRSAFLECQGLVAVHIPNSVISIGEEAFYGCTSLSSIILPNSVNGIAEGTFTHCAALTSVEIPNSVTTIGKFAFRHCSSLHTVAIPNSVTAIGYYAFESCSALDAVTIGSSVETIWDGAFSGCTALPSVVIPNSVKVVRGEVFRGCSALTSVTIGSSVNSIDNNAFGDCKNLEDVYCYAEKVPQAGEKAFAGSYIAYATLHVPESAMEHYKTKIPWSGFGAFRSLEGAGVETRKCGTPRISFFEGKLVFACETEDVEYVSEVKCPDAKSYYASEVPLNACYDISVRAMKSGYDNSDVATARLYWIASSGSLEETGTVAVQRRGVAIQSIGGYVNISGLASHETVRFYDIDGRYLGTATSAGGSASFCAQTGTVVVAKIANESVKIVVR